MIYIFTCEECGLTWSINCSFIEYQTYKDLEKEDICPPCRHCEELTEHKVNKDDKEIKF